MKRRRVARARTLFRMALLLSVLPPAAPGAQESPGAPEVRRPAARAPFPEGRFELETGDVIAFLGGGDVDAAQHTGHLEALLTSRYRDLAPRFRNFGWEGDTVQARPRDFGFPPLAEHLRRASATVIVLQFGRGEALGDSADPAGFTRNYEKLLDECARQTPRLVLVTPPPLESAGGLLPDLSARNPALARYAEAVRALAAKRRLPVVDLFAELNGVAHREPRLTSDGLQLTPRGQGLVAAAFARQLGFGRVAKAAGEPAESGAWPDPAYERLRQAIAAKNRLWFNYWRPQNWAFLGGDRTEQPSSRDHRNPSVRWFPAEMEKFLPLIQAREHEIADLANLLPRIQAHE